MIHIINHSFDIYLQSRSSKFWQIFSISMFMYMYKKWNEHFLLSLPSEHNIFYKIIITIHQHFCVDTMCRVIHPSTEPESLEEIGRFGSFGNLQEIVCEWLNIPYPPLAAGGSFHRGSATLGGATRGEADGCLTPREPVGGRGGVAGSQGLVCAWPDPKPRVSKLLSSGGHGAYSVWSAPPKLWGKWPVTQSKEKYYYWQIK